MALLLFDRKFGSDFINALPASPGVYEFQNKKGETLYVGQSKNLKRRMGQYRRPGRKKVDRKKWRV